MAIYPVNVDILVYWPISGISVTFNCILTPSSQLKKEEAYFKIIPCFGGFRL